MTFLVIEDEADVAEMLRRILEQLGNRCVVALDADRADRIVAEHEIDAVTLDLAMPGRGGMEWLEQMAGRRPDLARRTLVVTGRYLEPDQVERLARCGAGVLTKPFTLDSLAEAVRVQIDRPSASR